MFQRLLSNVLYPGYETWIRGRKTLQYRDEYDEQQWLSADELQSLQIKKLRRLLAYCQNHVPYYRRMFAELGGGWQDIHDLVDYARVPVLTPELLREHAEELIAGPHRKTNLKHLFRDSRGVPRRLQWSPESDERREALTMRAHAWAGVALGQPSVYLGGTEAEPATKAAARLKAQFRQEVLRQKHVPMGELSRKALGRAVASIHEFEPEWVSGETSALCAIAEYLGESSVRMHRPSSVLATGSLGAEQRELIKSAFGASVFHLYTRAEFGVVASEYNEGAGLHAHTDHLVVEVVDEEFYPPEDGGVGDLTLTDLHNFGMPLVRYQPAQRAELLEPSGDRSFPRLELHPPAEPSV